MLKLPFLEWDCLLKVLYPPCRLVNMLLGFEQQHHLFLSHSLVVSDSCHAAHPSAINYLQSFSSKLLIKPLLVMSSLLMVRPHAKTRLNKITQGVVLSISVWSSDPHQGSEKIWWQRFPDFLVVSDFGFRAEDKV